MALRATILQKVLSNLSGQPKVPTFLEAGPAFSDRNRVGIRYPVFHEDSFGR